METTTGTQSTEAAFPLDTHAIVEIMGHTKIAGRITQVGFGGTALLRVDVPAIPAAPASSRPGVGSEWGYGSDRPGQWVCEEMPARDSYTKMFGGAAIFSMRICSEEEALADEIARYDARPRPRFVPDVPGLPEHQADPHDPDNDDDLADAFAE